MLPALRPRTYEILGLSSAAGEAGSVHFFAANDLTRCSAPTLCSGVSCFATTHILGHDPAMATAKSDQTRGGTREPAHSIASVVPAMCRVPMAELK